jgi:hypothetical protein
MFQFFKLHFFSVLLFTILIFPFALSAQAPAYVPTISKCFGGSGSEEFFGAVPSMDGGYILSGLTNSYDGDIIQPLVYDTANIFVVKCDGAGNKEWAKAYGGNLYDKARFAFEDSDSNIIVIGTTQSIDGDITFNHGNSELFVLKLTSSGDIIWFKNYGGSGFESGRYGAQISDGNYLIGGYTASNDFDVPINRGYHDGWLLKIDTAGTIIWSQTYGGSLPERLRYFVEAPDGSIYFAGASESSDFQCSGNNGKDDVWVGKTDSNGNLLWNYQYGGTENESAYQITAISGDRYLITGNTSSSDGDVIGYKGGTTDGWIIMIDSSGTLLRQSCLGGTRGERLYNTLEREPNKFFSAGFTSSNDIDLAGTGAGPSNEYWLVSLDSLLQFEWSFVTGGSARDLGTELIYDPVDSSVVIIGDSNSSNGDVLGNHGDADFWMVKLSLFTSLSSPAEPVETNVYYQQETGSLFINSKVNSHTSVTVYDLTGREIFWIPDVKIEPGINVIKLEKIANAPQGIYMVAVPGTGLTKAVKIVAGQ